MTSGDRRRDGRLRKHVDGGVVRIIGILLAASLIARAAAADLWYEHYANAEQALSRKNWSEAVRELNEALERKADSGARVRSYGMKVVSYFPYLKLGIAYHELGQYDAALQAFDTEEKIGAVRESADAMAELERYRKLALAARAAEIKAQERRIATIVDRELARAADLESSGKLEEALVALGRALAVDPRNAALENRIASLRDKAAAEQRRHEDESRRVKLVAEGESLLDREAFAEASSRFRQALDIREDPKTRGLLRTAEAGLRQLLEAKQDQVKQREIVRENLATATRLAGEGDVGAALATLQLVLSLEPDDPAAATLHEQLLARKRAEDQSAFVVQVLEEADRNFAQGRFEESLAEANRALAFDSGNRTAVAYVLRAYRQINQRLLGSRSDQNIPPAIRFADFRVERNGARAQVVRDSDFTLSGLAIDDAEVSLRCTDQDGREIPVRALAQAVGEHTVTQFRIEDRVPRGSTIMRLVATDPAGQSSSSEYEVIFDPPFYRTASFRATAGAVPLIAVGGVVLANRRRRRRLLERRFNPYVAGAPVLDDDLFFGREALIDRILQTIHSNSLLLHGERRIGKTSLQHHLRKRLGTLDDPKYEFFPVYIDLQGTPEQRFFATLAGDIFDALAPELDGLEPLGDVSGNGEYGYRDFVADLRRVLAALKERSSRCVKLVLLIDEVDELNGYDPRINQKLRSLFMKNFAENLVSVVSGVQIKKNWEKEGSPWYNFFEEIEVKPFDRSAAVELVERPIRGVFHLEPGVTERILDVTACRPYLIQKLCARLISRMHEERRRTITLADVEAVTEAE